MNKKGIFVPTLVVLSIFVFGYLLFSNPVFSSDYRFKFMDVLGGELGLNREMFGDEQEIKYAGYKALDSSLGICDDWSKCKPKNEFKEMFNDIYDGDYEIEIIGFKIKAKKDINFVRKELTIKTKHSFNYDLGFNWMIVDELYNSCKDVKSCDVLGGCKAICSEDDIFLKFKYPIDLEFIENIEFKLVKTGALI